MRDTLEELGIEDVPLIGIAKGPHHGREGREVFHFPDGREKTLPTNSPVLFYLQRLRDEVHRYAIGAHRAKRSRAITASPLDEIPGIGPSRKRALLLHFGTASKVRAAALDDLQRAPGVSEAWRRRSTISITREVRRGCLRPPSTAVPGMRSARPCQRRSGTTSSRYRQPQSPRLARSSRPGYGRM